MIKPYDINQPLTAQEFNDLTQGQKLLDTLEGLQEAYGQEFDKQKILDLMSDEHIGNPNEAVEKLYGKLPEELIEPEVPEPVTRDNIASKLYEAVNEEPLDTSHPGGAELLEEQDRHPHEFKPTVPYWKEKEAVKAERLKKLSDAVEPEDENV